MIKCPQCDKAYSSDLTTCPKCEFTAAEADGFTAWAPEMAHGGGGFKREYFAGLALVEASNFWFRARNELILWALRTYFPTFQSLMEVGCGTGFVLSGIAQAFPAAMLVGSEIFTDGLHFAKARVPQARFMQMDARNIPFLEEFDVVAAFDVIEHIEEDTMVLKNLHSATKPGGGILISVPQHQWLWSEIDERSHHVRRYSAGDLDVKIRRVGFEILRSTSFVSFLLPAMALSRWQKNRTDIDPLAEFRISRTLNSTMESVMGIERALIRAGLNFSLGGSRLVLARKPT